MPARRVPRFVLLAVAAALVAGPAAAAAATTSGVSTTTTTTTTSTTAPPPASVLAAAADPCHPSSTGAPCTVDPTRLLVSYDKAKEPILTAVQVAWVPRKVGPAPAKPATTLLVGAASCTAKGTVTTCSWPWPSEMTYPTKSKTWVLDGSYQVTPCTTAGPCTPSKVYRSTKVALAVPPAVPTSFHGMSSASGTVNLAWSPAASPEPDLVGYRVSRNGQTLYTCSTAGAGAGAGNRCQSPLSFSDLPATGTWTYRVVALRFGPDASAASVVASSAATVTVPVIAAHTGPSGPVSFYLPPVPIVEFPPGVTPVVPPYVPPGASSPTTTIGPAGSQKLPYGSPAPSASTPAQDPAALSSNAKETGPTGSNVRSAAAVALGMIALALAVHVWYLRGEMRRFAARSRRQSTPRRRPL